MEIDEDEIDRDELIDILAQHRTDNMEVYDLERSYYDMTVFNLDDYTDEELQEMISQEIGEE